MPRRFLDATRSDWHLERDGDALVLHLARPVGAPLTVRAGEQTVAVVREGTHALLGPFDARFRHVLALEDAEGRRVEIAERRLPLEGPRNFRDLGGYPTHDGRRVRWGQVFRADSLAELSEGDIGYLERLGLARVIDLRGDGEISERPNRLAGRSGFAYLQLPIGESDLAPAEWARKFEAGEFGEIDASWLVRGYQRTLDERAQRVGGVLRELAAHPSPAVFHCTAGKDRTGVVAALLLLALGVPREVVIGDYSLTALYTGNRIPAADQWFAERGIEPERAAHVLSSRREAMEVTLAHLDAAHGGPERFVREKACVTERELAALREWLLE
ncbi:MAG TPA: tyrosine-protein phosphatase [Myxococcota bacterium]|nr:tyrosine-protein phosphatase [Myxococcota bacterium]